MSRLRVGVVGVGALGRHHARIYSQMPGVELVAVADPSAERGRTVAEACSTRWAADFRDLVGQVDGVSIAVPTSGHLDVASAFLEQGIATLVEKPLACDVVQATRLVALAQRSGATLQVGHVERFNPAYEVARTLTGPPKYVRCERLSPFAFRSMDIGVVLDVMIHDIDLVLDLAAAPLPDVDAFGISILGQDEDCVQARLVFENGCIADLSANRVNPTSRRTMQIWSSAGCVALDFSSREVVRYAPGGRLASGDSPLDRARAPQADIEQLKASIFGEYIEVARPDVPKSDALTAELANFVAAARDECAPRVDGRAALAAMKTADRVLKSVASHCWNGRAAGPIGPFPGVATPLRRAA